MHRGALPTGVFGERRLMQGLIGTVPSGTVLFVWRAGKMAEALRFGGLYGIIDLFDNIVSYLR